MVPFVTNLFTEIASEITYIEVNQLCTLSSTQSERLALSLALSTRSVVISADIIVILVTWLKTGRTYREARQQKVVAPLSRLLLRDGTIYFLVLLVINILVPINDITSLANFDFATSFLTTLAPIIICRFILNLRQIDDGGSSLPSGGRSTGLRFASNMGQPLHTGIEEEDELTNHSTPGEGYEDSSITRPQRESDEEGMSRNDVEAELVSF
ncbi:hypothetical protein BC629DRAFT_1106994 [Irpex lacteus]|nr:hypothetical protein BC629DRAFT_1106994 [Irpex lacteus]